MLKKGFVTITTAFVSFAAFVLQQVVAQTTSTVISFDDFESGWGNFAKQISNSNDVSKRCGGNDAQYSRGDCSIRIRDNSGDASAMVTTVNVEGYDKLEIDFYYYAKGMEEGEDFFVESSIGDAGTEWTTHADYVSTVHFTNDDFYHPTETSNISIDVPPGTTTMRIRFRCDASGKNDYIYIDDVTISGISSSTPPLTSSPTPLPTSPPTEIPTAPPTMIPTAFPTAPPSVPPTAVPTSLPTAPPSPLPTSPPSLPPTTSPTSLPTAPPSPLPTSPPSLPPSTSPTPVPTSSPTSNPTPIPTAPPTPEEILISTLSPTVPPSPLPTSPPTTNPTPAPTNQPTPVPTNSPTPAPTGQPTSSPTLSPTFLPTAPPTANPTQGPTAAPTSSPTSPPSTSPTAPPTALPTSPPSSSPTSPPTPESIPESTGPLQTLLSNDLVPQSATKSNDVRSYFDLKAVDSQNDVSVESISIVIQGGGIIRLFTFDEDGTVAGSEEEWGKWSEVGLVESNIDSLAKTEVAGPFNLNGETGVVFYRVEIAFIDPVVIRSGNTMGVYIYLFDSGWILQVPSTAIFGVTYPIKNQDASLAISRGVLNEEANEYDSLGVNYRMTTPIPPPSTTPPAEVSQNFCPDEDPTKYNICIDPLGAGTYILDETIGILSAKARWEEIITGNLESVSWSSASPPLDADLQGPRIPVIIDDLYILVDDTFIDGAFGILGSAGPTNFRSGNGPQLPVAFAGYISIDGADINRLLLRGTWENLILHEIGHVLGIGTLWNSFGLVLESNGIYTYNGAYACAQWQGLQGHDLASCGECPPVEGLVNGEVRSGTTGGHWNEGGDGGGVAAIDNDGPAMDTELMTGFFEGSGPQPISTVTIGSLEDLGYTVDYAKANPYNAPSCSRRNLGPTNLRGLKPKNHSPGKAISDAARNKAIVYGKGLLRNDPIGDLCIDVLVYDDDEELHSVLVCPDMKLPNGSECTVAEDCESQRCHNARCTGPPSTEV